jgi:capsular exopolysaccharide synthesis family protein
MATLPGPLEIVPPVERELDFRYYADLLWRSRYLLFATALGGLAMGILVAEVQTPRYRARTLLQVAPPNPTSLSVTDALVSTGNPVRDRQFFNTQLNVLVSRTLGERVVDKLKLKDQPPFKDSADAAGLLMKHVTVDPIPETFVIEVAVSHQDPKEAALWANTLADTYIDYSLEGQVESAKRAYQWVTERLADTQKDMQEQQDQLLKSYQGQDLFVPEGSVSAVTTSITKLNEDHIQAQARRIALEAELQEIADMRRRDKSLDSVPQVAADAQIVDMNGKLQTLNLDLSRLKEKYKEAHPEVQKVQVQIDQIRRAKLARAVQIEEALRAEYRQLQRRESELKQAIESQKSQAVAQSRKLTELESLKKRADASTNLYTVLLQKLNETNIAASIQNNNVRLLDKAMVPTSPVWPQKQKVAFLSLLLGLVLGGGYVLFRDLVENTIKDADDVERYLHLDLLAAVPRYTKDNTQLATEAYQTLRTALLFGRREERGQVVLVTGTAPGEGKTTTLLNVAKLLAVSGESTVMLDCDLRRAQLHSRLGLQREPGLTDYFVKRLDMNALVQGTRVKNLFALTAGPLPPNPPGILTRPDVATSLDQLRRHFRWVLIDTPPIASVTDALLLARHADMAVLVIQHNKVDKKVVKRSLAALRKVQPNVLGAVLNAVDIKTKGYHYYYYQQQKDKKPGGVEARKGRPSRPAIPTVSPDASLI